MQLYFLLAILCFNAVFGMSFVSLDCDVLDSCGDNSACVSSLIERLRMYDCVQTHESAAKRSPFSSDKRGPQRMKSLLLKNYSTRMRK